MLRSKGVAWLEVLERFLQNLLRAQRLQDSRQNPYPFCSASSQVDAPMRSASTSFCSQRKPCQNLSESPSSCSAKIFQEMYRVCVCARVRVS